MRTKKSIGCAAACVLLAILSVTLPNMKFSSENTGKISPTERDAQTLTQIHDELVRQGEITVTEIADWNAIAFLSKKTTQDISYWKVSRLKAAVAELPDPLN